MSMCVPHTSILHSLGADGKVKIKNSHDVCVCEHSAVRLLLGFRTVAFSRVLPHPNTVRALSHSNVEFVLRLNNAPHSPLPSSTFP